MFRKTLTALAIFGSMASAHSAALIDEGFENVFGLQAKGWVLTNASTPAGATPGWFQGIAATPGTNFFNAQAGAPTSYAAADYNNAGENGTIRNYLITPQFSTAESLFVSFWARGIAEPDFFDQFAFGFSNGSSAISAFNLGPVVTAQTSGWTQYLVTLGAQGANSVGRFAIEYTGSQANADYFGIDSLVVQVPEPSTWMMLGAGSLALLGLRRRKQI